MENASQALIIAGAILLAILLIAIGMFIFNKANTSIQDAAKGMDKNAIAVVNGKFTPYQGKISGTEFKGLLGVWGQYHSQLDNEGAEEFRYIGLKGNKTAFTGKTAIGAAGLTSKTDLVSSNVLGWTNNVKDLDSFNISFEYSTSGLITKIIVDSTTTAR